jgi:hypothetical protein
MAKDGGFPVKLLRVGRRSRSQPSGHRASADTVTESVNGAVTPFVSVIDAEVIEPPDSTYQA